MDFYGDFTSDSALEPEPDPGNLDDDLPLQESGVIGIKVKQPKEKRYANLVS